MELIKIHYNPAKPVTSYKEIETEIVKLKKFIVEADKKRECYAIHHGQVHPHPYNFFVVHPRYCLGNDRLFNHNVIINPKIISSIPYLKPEFKDTGLPDDSRGHATYAQMPKIIESQFELEGCMSFPFRKPKRVQRFVRIKVSYQNEKLEPITTILEGPAAQIFQHETDHASGKNIFFNK